MGIRHLHLPTVLLTAQVTHSASQMTPVTFCRRYPDQTWAVPPHIASGSSAMEPDPSQLVLCEHDHVIGTLGNYVYSRRHVDPRPCRIYGCRPWRSAAALLACMYDEWQLSALCRGRKHVDVAQHPRWEKTQERARNAHYTLPQGSRTRANRSTSINTKLVKRSRELG